MGPLDYYNSLGYRILKPIRRAWLKYLLSQDRLVKVSYKYRGVGKTYMMIERSIKLNIPIVVGNQAMADHIKRNGNPVEVIRLAKGYTLEIKGKGRDFPNGVMIDDSVSPKMVNIVADEGIVIRGGFLEEG